MKILIADDHQLVRDAISTYLEHEDDITVSVASDLDGALSQIEAEGPYDLVLLDYKMPGMNALSALELTREKNGGRPVALMSGTAPKRIALEALEVGAAGFLPKSMPVKSLVHAARFMASGEQYAPIEFFTDEDEAHPLTKLLTERELEVLDGLCRGLANKEIARELDLREVTVKLHVKAVCRKLEARNRTHAAMIARDAGLF